MRHKMRFNGLWFAALQLCLIALKLLGVIKLSWWHVCAPTLFVAGLVVAIVVILFFEQ